MFRAKTLEGGGVLSLNLTTAYTKALKLLHFLNYKVVTKVAIKSMFNAKGRVENGLTDGQCFKTFNIVHFLCISYLFKKPLKNGCNQILICQK